MFEIEDLEQLRALASPVRQGIVDALEALGPSTVAELAEVLDAPADGLYYHLRILKRRGLVVEQGRSARAGRPQATFDVAGRPTLIRYAPQTPERVAAITRLVGSMVRSALRSFRRSLVPGVEMEGPRRSVWAGRRTARLSPERLEEVNALVGRVMQVLEESRGSNGEGKMYSFTFALSPLAHGRRSRAGSE